MSTVLVKYDEMCRAIDTCYRVDVVKGIRDKALALQHVAKVARNEEAERKCAEIRLRAERKAGQLLREMRERGERDPGGRGRRIASNSTTQLPNLQDIGITRDQSSLWQQLAEVPERQFEAGLRREGRVPTTNQFVRPERHRTVTTFGRSMNGALQGDLWHNRLDQVFGATAIGRKLLPAARLYQFAQRHVCEPLNIFKAILTLSTLLPDDRHWPGDGQPKQLALLLRFLFEHEKVEACLQDLCQLPLEQHEAYLERLLRDAHRAAEAADTMEAADAEA